MPEQASSSKGFTLIELLVTVSIIAVLLGVLLPSINSSRRQARLVACGVNLRSIGQLIQAYATENDGRISRGPSCRAVGYSFALRDVTIATNQIWTQYPGPPDPDPQTPRCLRSCGQWDINALPPPPAPLPSGGNGITDGEYMGLGLLTRERDANGNKFLYCPADDKLNFQEESAKIGFDDQAAFGSYLYRQMDMTPPEIECEGKLDDLRYNERILGSATVGGGPYRLDVHALALDVNSAGGTEETTTSNHDGLKVNVVYKDGSVNPFDNKAQLVRGDEQPWATVQGFAGFPNDVLWNLDRIFLAADFSFVRKEPWLAPVP